MFSLDPRGGHNRYKFNKDFFKKWTHKMAYVLGFLYADGNITNSIPSRAQYIHFYSTDKDILERIKSVLSSNHTLEVIPVIARVRGSGFKRKKPGFRLRIGSREMYQDLINLGVVPRKSLVAIFPKIPYEYLGSFLRGNFDGDGCVFLEKAKGITQAVIIKKLSVIFTSGSYKFLEGLAESIKKNLAINHTKIYKGNRSFQLRYSTRDSIELFKLMYEDCPTGLYLERKSNIFNEYFQMAPQKVNSPITEILSSLSNGHVAKLATRRSAKPLYMGANPIMASKLVNVCPGGEIGKRISLKMIRRKACGFNSHPGHRLRSLLKPPF